jgi:hypothetical protein
MYSACYRRWAGRRKVLYSDEDIVITTRFWGFGMDGYHVEEACERLRLLPANRPGEGRHCLRGWYVCWGWSESRDCSRLAS